MKLTPEIMHELIEKSVVHTSYKSSGRRKQKATSDFTSQRPLRIDYDKKIKVA